MLTGNLTSNFRQLVFHQPRLYLRGFRTEIAHFQMKCQSHNGIKNVSYSQSHFEHVNRKLVKCVGTF